MIVCLKELFVGGGGVWGNAVRADDMLVSIS